MMGYPYAQIEMSKITWPSIDDVAIMLTDAVRLSGVKTTSNRLAVNPESSWHAPSDVDRSTYSALVGRMTVARDERRMTGLIDGRRMAANTALQGSEGHLSSSFKEKVRSRRHWILEYRSVTGIDVSG